MTNNTDNPIQLPTINHTNVNAYHYSTQYRFWHWKKQGDIDNIRLTTYNNAINDIKQYIDQQKQLTQDDEIQEQQAEEIDRIDGTHHAVITSLNEDPLKHHTDHSKHHHTVHDTPTNALAKKLQLQTPHNDTHNTISTDNIPSDTDKLEYLTPDECNLLLLYYRQSILLLSTALNYPSYITYTAYTLYNRFYLYNTPMQCHPKLIMLCCFFIAGKVEDHWISSQTLADKTKTTIDNITKYELIIMQTIKFNLRIWHANKPLDGLIYLLKDKHNITIQQNIIQRCNELIDISYYTDIQFLYAPSNIALSVLYTALHEDNKDDNTIDILVKSQLQHNDSNNNDTEQLYNKLLNRLQIIQQLLYTGNEYKQHNRKELGELCKPIDKKQKIIQNIFNEIQEQSKLQDQQLSQQRHFDDKKFASIQNVISGFNKNNNNDNDIHNNNIHKHSADDSNANTTQHKPINPNDSDDDLGFRIKRRKSKHAIIDDEDD